MILIPSVLNAEYSSRWIAPSPPPPQSFPLPKPPHPNLLVPHLSLTFLYSALSFSKAYYDFIFYEFFSIKLTRKPS
jgi:hypothetical protein